MQINTDTHNSAKEDVEELIASNIEELRLEMIAER